MKLTVKPSDLLPNRELPVELTPADALDIGFCLGLQALAMATCWNDEALETGDERDALHKVADETLEELVRQHPELEMQDWAKWYRVYSPLENHVWELIWDIHKVFNGTYSDYLESEAWHEKAEAAKERAGYRCQLCNTSKRTLHTHHRTYERLREELPDDLIVLCADCHAKFHDKLPAGSS